MAKKYYAVLNGRHPGVYETWEDCKKEVHGYPGAAYKSFPTREAALEFLGAGTPEPAASADAVAYVDGSYDHGQKKFSFGAVLLYNKEERQFCEAFSDPELASMRNVAGEIKGAEFIMRYCAEHGIPGIDIYYDYAGIEKWCTGEWKASKAGTQRYAALYKELSKTVAIRFVKVKGHSGDKYNDLADKLAKKALGIE